MKKEYLVNKCDICHVEYRSDDKVKRHWTDAIESVFIDFKRHPALQCSHKLDLCRECAQELYGKVIKITKKMMNKKRKPEEE